VQELGRQRLQDKIREEQEQPGQRGHRITRQLQSKNRITSLEDLDQFIADLRQIRGELQYAHEFELTINLEDDK
jgi:glutamate synthase domain-containing protein 2